MLLGDLNSFYDTIILLSPSMSEKPGADIFWPFKPLSPLLFEIWFFIGLELPS